MNLKHVVLMATATFFFVSCSSDDNDDNNAQNYKVAQYLDATSYEKWTYFSFEEEKVTATSVIADEEGNITDENGAAFDETSIKWDIALHRYDVRTNGAKAYDTQKVLMDDVTTVPTGVTYTADVESSVYWDMSGMLEGNILTSTTYLNEVLCGWCDQDISVMPPVYTLYKNVYVIELSDGRHTKIQFTDRLSATGVAAYISFNYEYLD